MKIGDVASAIGKGLVAGAAGTVAVTASQMLAQKLVGQEPSTAPAEATEKVLGVEPKGEQEEQRLNQTVHFAYGTAWGVPRALLAVFGLSPVTATAAHFAAVQGASMAMLPGLDIAPPPHKWGLKEIALESFHHLVYAVATGLTLGFLDRRSERARLAAA